MLPIVYHPDYIARLPDAHRFPMPKFAKIYEVLVKDGIATVDQFHIPEIAQREWITLVHSPSYVDAYLTGTLDPKAMRRIGFPWSQTLVKRTCTAIGGTILTAQLALTHGLACSTAGGTHHAHVDFGSGFCIFNDIAVAARYVQASGATKLGRDKIVERILIVDLDVHQGDGTAAIFKDDPSVFTFSAHCEKNFPFRKQESDLDIGMAVNTADALYLATLQSYLPNLLDDLQPDLVFYDAGVDPHVSDRLGKLALTDIGLKERDEFVLESCLQRGIPVATVVGGGYGDNIEVLARRHAILHGVASKLFDQYL